MPEAKYFLMCEPRSLPDTVPYAINPWMQEGQRLNPARARAQWNNLVGIYEELGVKVATITQQPGLPDMVFAADQGIMHSGGVLLSNFRHKERRGETDHYRQWFRENGYAVTELPTQAFFEGNGESYRWKDKRLLGVGFRSDHDTVPFLQRQLTDEEVVPLEIVDEDFYHLDTALLPLDEATIFYYPQAFSEAAQTRLHTMVDNLIPMTEREARGFSANSVRVGENVVFQKGNDTFAERLREAGYTPVETDISEFNKLGGGIHCLTNVLEEN